MSLPLAQSRLAAARHVVVLTGAGISAESGLRTFRGSTGASAEDLPADMQTLWKEFDPMRLATPEAFDADPAMVTRWYDWRRRGCLAAEPNPGHAALAKLERDLTARGGTFTLLTQNVDRLHQRAGSVNVVELHGTILEWRCTRTQRRFTPGPEPMTEFPPRSPFHPEGLLRPDVVWFGEMLPEVALAASARAVERCDLFMSVGTSSVVYPAAAYVRAASANGAFTIEVNLEPTPISGWVDAPIHAKAGEVLPRMVC
ncbi:NAD-dependent protein deacylase [Phycisphaerales bacterium]|nr:NAD-dependent protein deacylase [Phycisphaerales bacterium]